MKTHDGSTFGRKFANFNVIQTNFKEVNEHKIRADFIVPKSFSTDGPPRPVIARFHGGGLTRGDSIYEDWFPLWLLELAETYGAVIASANYRFLPEATGLQILDDVEDFWSWLHSAKVNDFLASQPTPIELDLSRILTAGDSAGGLLSVYLTLSHPDEIRAGTATYPVLHWDDPPLYPATRSPLMPEIPESVIDEYLATVGPKYIESSDLDLKRMALSSAISQHRRGRGFYMRGVSEDTSDWDRLFQLARLDRPEAKLPRGGLVIIHGVDDDLVPVEASERFIEKAKTVLAGDKGGSQAGLCLRPGAHGFDINVSFNEEWLRDALSVALETWLE